MHTSKVKGVFKVERSYYYNHKTNKSFIDGNSIYSSKVYTNMNTVQPKKCQRFIATIIDVQIYFGVIMTI